MTDLTANKQVIKPAEFEDWGQCLEFMLSMQDMYSGHLAFLAGVYTYWDRNGYITGKQAKYCKELLRECEQEFYSLRREQKEPKPVPYSEKPFIKEGTVH